MQDRLGRDGRDMTAAGQPAQEQRVALLRGAGLERADDLRPARVQPHPAGIRALGQAVGDALGAAGGGLQTDDPVHPPGLRPVDEAEHAQPGRFRQPPVPARDGLVGDPQRGGQHAVGRPRRHQQRVEKLAVNGVQLTGFHGGQLNMSSSGEIAIRYGAAARCRAG